jgi:alkanesulfonate monooxygenase SsuD/methylene tetrahydromethanopterin reductase-like flavin-dependent oxidoreductase (luciferase family)
MIPGADPELVMRWAARADAGPFSSLATGELLTSHAYDPFVALSAAAAVTRRIQLFTNVLVLPLHNAGVVAKQAASLDRLSGGRLLLGLGVGARKPTLTHAAGEAPPDADLPDFTAAPAPAEGRYERFGPQVAYMRHIWRGEPVTDSGLGVGPTPVTPAGPELIFGGYAPRLVAESVTWAAGFSAFGLAPDTDRIARDFDVFRSAWKSVGRPGKPRLLATHFFALGPSAESGTREYIRRHYSHLSVAQAALLEGAISTTRPERLREVFRQLVEAGATDVVPIPIIADLDQLDRLADVLGPDVGVPGGDDRAEGRSFSSDVRA